MPNNIETPLSPSHSKMKSTSPLIQDNEPGESLSLTNSPIAQSAPQFTSEPTELFEFYSGSDINLQQKMMSDADDIIFCGKLIPLKQQESHDNVTNVYREHGCHDVIDVVRKEGEEREREGGGRMLKYATQPNSPRSRKYMMMRNSKSLDYEHLRRSLSSDFRGAGIRRYSSTRSSDRYDTSGQIKVHKPRWYFMLFGLVSKTPPETMELRDMKNRLVRRTPSTMFQSDNTTSSNPTTRNQRKGSWGLLSVLSCKDDASIRVATALSCMPHVNSCDDIYSPVSCT